ncbi:unnamed protein product, partial [Notodromas monacha]
TESNPVKIIFDAVMNGIRPFPAEDTDLAERRASSHKLTFNYELLKEKLVNESPMNRALLLQAIRWCITKDTCAWSREQHICDLVEKDFLSLLSPVSERSAVFDFGFLQVPVFLEQSQLRILCTLASFPVGGVYLSSVDSLVALLAEKLASYKLTSRDDGVMRDLLIATCHKLSIW